MQPELERRRSFTESVVAFFRAHPNRGIHCREFEPVGGRQAWRSRIADARKVFRAEGGEIWNTQYRTKVGVESYYMYTPQQSIGRDAGTITDARLFD